MVNQKGNKWKKNNSKSSFDLIPYFSNIEVGHLLFCANFMNIFSYGVLNLDIFPSGMLRGCLVCVMSNSNSIQSFEFKLCLMVVHILKMCTLLFCALFMNIFFIFTGC